ncbi:MAG: Fic/DOC family N-terminal domain-containing protein [Candidatus Pacebacteria bacterium]|nr:Fic/DOC family N-terminal domain-containing protein [Candidatus Paceibacterota bacterium]
MKPFIPDALPPPGLRYDRLSVQIGPTTLAVARYDSLLQSVTNRELLLAPLTTQEAVLSSKIEGTQATLDEVFRFEAGMEFTGEKYEDIQEVLNYRNALVMGSKALEHRPLSLGLIKELHATLMNSVRGASKTPGLFRIDQNWIGAAGTPIEAAKFVPPSPLQLQDHLEKFENFMHQTDIDPLIQTAVIHAQFELLHPFNDGNGRVGRLLIPLYLYRRGVLGSPSFYLSEYLENNREAYYSRLTAISKENDWQGWIEFFLVAVEQQALKNIGKLHKVMALYNGMKDRVSNVIHSKYNFRFLDALFHRPVFQSTDFIQISRTPHQASLQFLNLMVRERILRLVEESSGRRPKTFVFVHLLNITEGYEVIKPMEGE